MMDTKDQSRSILHETRDEKRQTAAVIHLADDCIGAKLTQTRNDGEYIARVQVELNDIRTRRPKCGGQRIVVLEGDDEMASPIARGLDQTQQRDLSSAYAQSWNKSRYSVHE